jgi:nicotinamidase-related amidase
LKKREEEIMVSRTALFVIDIQAELASDPNTAIPHAARIRAAGSALLARARGVVDASNPSDLEIVIVQHAEDPQGTDATLIAGSKAWELLFPPRAESKDERLVAKTTGRH